MQETHGIPDPAPAPQPAFNLKDALEVASKSVIALAGLCYVLGLIVNNIHLSQYGYFSLNLLQLNYIFAGFWTLLPIIVGTLAANFVYLPYSIQPRKSDEKDGAKLGEGRSLKRSIIASSIMSILLILTLVFTARAYVDFRLWPWVLASLLGLLAGVGFMFFANFLFLKRSISYSLYSFAFFAFALTSYLSYFASNVYHAIPMGLGGGRPAVVRFVVAKEAKPYFDASGVPISEHDNKSEPVDLLLNSAEGYVVKSRVTGGTVVIPHAPVKSVLFESR